MAVISDDHRRKRTFEFVVIRVFERPLWRKADIRALVAQNPFVMPASLLKADIKLMSS